MKGIGMLGALRYLTELADLNEVREFYGTSVGSIIAVFTALGFSAEEMFLYFTQVEFEFRPSVSMRDIQLVNYQKFIDYLSLIIKHKCKTVPTLRDLWKQGKNLYLVTFNYSTNSMVILSYKTHPDMPCTEAIRLSCALPFIFGKNIYNNDLYIDGGLVCNFPLDLAVEDGARDIVAINVFSPPKQRTDDAVLPMIFNILFAPIEKQTSDVIKKYRKDCTLIELSFSIPFTQFKINFRTAIENFLIGYVNCRYIMRLPNDAAS